MLNELINMIIQRWLGLLLTWGMEIPYLLEGKILCGYLSNNLNSGLYISERWCSFNWHQGWLAEFWLKIGLKFLLRKNPEQFEDRQKNCFFPPKLFHKNWSSNKVPSGSYGFGHAKKCQKISVAYKTKQMMVWGMYMTVTVIYNAYHHMYDA